MRYDADEREYILDHGGYFDRDGMAVIPKQVFDKEQYVHKSFLHPGKYAWMIPCCTGLVLLFEGLHYRVEG